MYKKMYIAPKICPSGAGWLCLFCFAFSLLFPLDLGLFFRPSRAQNNPKSQCLLQSIAYYMLTDSKNRPSK